MKAADAKKFDLQEFMATLNTLDPENVGSWPTPVKILVYIVVFIVVLVLGYTLELSSMRDTVATGEQQQQTLLTEYEGKVFKAQNLSVYKQQLKDMEDSFGALLRQLPADTEVPGLLEDIDHTGVGSGLTVNSIDLGQEVAKDFYAEQPITIKVQGDYHAFGAFVSGVSALPRIVTLHDFKIDPIPSRFKDDGAPVLTMTILAKTYRYTDANGSGKGKTPDAKAGDKK